MSAEQPLGQNLVDLWLQTVRETHEINSIFILCKILKWWVFSKRNIRNPKMTFRMFWSNKSPHDNDYYNIFFLNQTKIFWYIRKCHILNVIINITTHLTIAIPPHVFLT